MSRPSTTSRFRLDESARADANRLCLAQAQQTPGARRERPPLGRRARRSRHPRPRAPWWRQDRNLVGVSWSRVRPSRPTSRMHSVQPRDDTLTSAITSVPMPSPGRRRSLCVAMMIASIDLFIVIAGLDPAIQLSCEEDGCPGIGVFRTPFFERLCPGMTEDRICADLLKRPCRIGKTPLPASDWSNAAETAMVRPTAGPFVTSPA